MITRSELGLLPTAQPRTIEAAKVTAVATQALSVGATLFAAVFATAAGLSVTGVGAALAPVVLVAGAVLANALKKHGWTKARTAARDTASKIAQQLLEADAAYQAAVEIGLKPRNPRRDGGLLARVLTDVGVYHQSEGHGSPWSLPGEMRSLFPDAFPDAGDTEPVRGDLKQWVLKQANALSMEWNEYKDLIFALPWVDIVEDIRARARIARATLLEPAAGLLPPGRIYDAAKCISVFTPLEEQSLLDARLSAGTKAQQAFFAKVGRAPPTATSIQQVEQTAALRTATSFPGVRLLPGCSRHFPGVIAANAARQAQLLREYRDAVGSSPETTRSRWWWAAIAATAWWGLS